MKHEARVVVEGEVRAVGIPSVAYIPFLHLPASHVDAVLVELSAGFRQQTLDGRGEEEPVGVGRVNLAERLELFDVPLLGHFVEGHPQGVPSTEERFGEEGGIHQILSRTAPAQIVGRVGVDGVLVGCQGPFPQFFALLALGCLVVGQCQPRGDTRHQSAESLHIHHAAVAIVERRRELGLHVLLQLACGHVLEDGTGHLVSQRTPVFTVGLFCLLRFLGGLQRHQ